ncbi:MAG TPA: hypothetical protein DCO77_13120 [Nitrospiraceae bacterium]|nr:hypothetical protein [Nitrospiraceae bacterium]
MKVLAMLTAWGLLLAPFSAGAEFYRWVDREGLEHYTNTPAKVPPQYRDRLEPVGITERKVNVGDETTVPAESSSAAIEEHRDNYGRGEAWWRRKASTLRVQLKDLQGDYRQLEKQEQEWQDTQKFVIGAGKKKTSPYLKKMASLEKKITKVRRRLEVDLPEEARKADAYPGWIRE